MTTATYYILQLIGLQSVSIKSLASCRFFHRFGEQRPTGRQDRQNLQQQQQQQQQQHILGSKKRIIICQVSILWSERMRACLLHWFLTDIFHFSFFFFSTLAFHPFTMHACVSLEQPCLLLCSKGISNHHLQFSPPKFSRLSTRIEGREAAAAEAEQRVLFFWVSLKISLPHCARAYNVHTYYYYYR